jgi:hypothetical protein
MARNIEIAPGTYVFGNVTIQVGYQAADHSQIVWLVSSSGSQTQLEGLQPRNGNANQMVLQPSVVVADQQAVGAQTAQGGPVGSVNVPRGGAFSNF